MKTCEIKRVIDGQSGHQFTVQELMELFGPVHRDPETGERVIVGGNGGNGNDDDDEFEMALDQVTQDYSDLDEPTIIPNRS